MAKRVLFLCTSNRCRSQMAEALVNHYMGDRFEAFSAGTAPSEPHPLALKVLAELGIDHPGARSKHLDEFANQTFDHVITLCDNANQACPVFVGGVKRVHLGFEDPDRADGNEDERLTVFRKVRDQIRQQVEACLNQEAGNEPVDIKLELS
jgi:arsenate reductase (thioredoxin)